MKARLGTGTARTYVRMSRGLPQGSLECRSHLHNDHGTGAEGTGQELDSSKTTVESGRLCAGWDLPRSSDVVAGGGSDWRQKCSEKLREVGLAIGAEKTHWCKPSGDGGLENCGGLLRQ